MSNDAEKNDLKGKGKKAYYRLQAIKNKIEAVEGQLVQASNELARIARETPNEVKCPKNSYNNKSKGDPIKKRRSMAKNAPGRIDFEFNCLEFYIDFSFISSQHDNFSDIVGVIVYGACRTVCFAECIYQDRNEECKSCERIVRCDRREDKPFIKFSITSQGRITSSGELDDEWWLKDTSDLRELHYRALDIIWNKALDWANEDILP